MNLLHMNTPDGIVEKGVPALLPNFLTHGLPQRAALVPRRRADLDAHAVSNVDKIALICCFDFAVVELGFSIRPYRRPCSSAVLQTKHTLCLWGSHGMTVCNQELTA
jgi:hypothetical protein